MAKSVDDGCGRWHRAQIARKLNESDLLLREVEEPVEVLGDLVFVDVRIFFKVPRDEAVGTSLAESLRDVWNPLRIFGDDRGKDLKLLFEGWKAILMRFFS